jgi:hypothetical protein
LRDETKHEQKEDCVRISHRPRKKENKGFGQKTKWWMSEDLTKGQRVKQFCL